MKRKRFSFSGIALLFILTAVLIICGAQTFTSDAYYEQTPYSYKYNISPKGHFDIEYEGQKYTCYKITNAAASQNNSSSQPSSSSTPQSSSAPSSSSVAPGSSNSSSSSQSGVSQELPKVAIKWKESLTDGMSATTINVPSIVTESRNNAGSSSSSSSQSSSSSGGSSGQSLTRYQVVAIAECGFKRTRFTEINIPNAIDEIREEAFAYCMNLETFTFPWNISFIPPSMFLNCTSLAKLRYRGSNGNQSLDNNSIVTIGDHAFDSCINLTNFICPIKAQNFCRSCFQRCKNLTSFYFPSVIEDNNHAITNFITVKEYAFADCEKLETVYFQENMQTIERYAFINCNTLMRFQFTGNSSALSSILDDDGDLWRRKYLASGVIENFKYGKGKGNPESDYYQIDYSVEKIYTYKGLRYAVRTANNSNKAVYLDSAGANPDSYVPKLITSGDYIAIKEFYAPFEWEEDYFEQVGSGDDFRIIIPNTINGKTVKVIESGAFNNYDNNRRLKEVVFNQSLVQIKHEAFLNCVNIQKLDFYTKGCNALREISYDVFQERRNPSGDELFNTNLREIKLPPCLEYIGEFAFYNFLGAESIAFGNSSQLKVIGAFAFAIRDDIPKNDDRRSNVTNFDLILPSTLSDTSARNAKYIHASNGIRSLKIAYKDEYDSTPANRRGYAIGRNAFENRTEIRSVTMQSASGGSVSIASNAFAKCSNLLTFTANKNLLLLGPGVFNSCGSLKEVFLTTQNDANYPSESSSPWGISDNADSYGGTLFSGPSSGWTISKDVVIYVSGTKAPKVSDTITGNTTYRWNTQTASSYDNELQGSGGTSNRSHIPTYYNVNWLGTGALTTDVYKIAYWRPIDNTFLSKSPKTLFSYNQGIVAIIKNTDSSDATNYRHCKVVKQYFDSNTGGAILKNSSALTAEDFNASHWTPIEEFSGRSAYTASSSHVIYEGSLYLCNTSISAPAANADDNLFDPTKWTLVSSVSGVDNYSSSSAYVASSIVKHKAETIDLTLMEAQTILNSSTSITVEIGDEAFADDSATENRTMGFYFILSNTITSIDERSFYRKGAVNTYGVRVVTYNNGTGNLKPGGYLDMTPSSYFSSYGGYCILPNTTTTIDRDAFYNNSFKSVAISGNINYLGSNAFYSHASKSQISSFELSDITPSINANFELDTTSGGVYYIGDATKKTLLYQIPSGANATACTATKTNDVAIDSTKKYYTKSAKTTSSKVGIGGYLVDIDGYSYTLVASPSAGNLANYYEVSILGTDNELNIASGTKTVGLRAVANTNVTSVEFNDGLVSIMGGAFQKSNLKYVYGSGLATIEYICSRSLYDNLKVSGWTKINASYFNDNIAYAAGTYVLSDSGKLYKSNTAVSAPAEPGEGEELVPNSLTDSSWDEVSYSDFSPSETYSTNSIVKLNSIYYIFTGTTSTAYLHYNEIDSVDVYSQYSRAQTGAFRECTGLTTFNFNAMTSLKAIGSRAFQKCSSLTEMTGGAEYRFYTSPTNGNKYHNDTNSKPIVVSSGVLDLGNKTAAGGVDDDYDYITKIEEYAFTDCPIDYLILPQTVSVGKESKLSISSNTPFRDAAKKLVGETVAQAKVGGGADGDENLHPSSHYPANSLKGSVYYRSFSSSDLTSANVKYWTIYTTGGKSYYYLFENKAAAVSFYS